jgi:hypothetical protein
MTNPGESAAVVGELEQGARLNLSHDDINALADVFPEACLVSVPPFHPLFRKRPDLGQRKETDEVVIVITPRSHSVNGRKVFAKIGR